MARGIPIFPVFPVAILNANKFAVLSLQIFLKIAKATKAITVLKRKKKIGRNRTEESSLTLIVALKTIIGPRINNTIFVIVYLSHFKKAVENSPNKILKYKGTIFPKRVKNILISILTNFYKDINIKICKKYV